MRQLLGLYSQKTLLPLNFPPCSGSTSSHSTKFWQWISKTSLTIAKKKQPSRAHVSWFSSFFSLALNQTIEVLTFVVYWFELYRSKTDGEQAKVRMNWDMWREQFLSTVFLCLFSLHLLGLSPKRLFNFCDQKKKTVPLKKRHTPCNLVMIQPLVFFFCYLYFY